MLTISYNQLFIVILYSSSLECVASSSTSLNVQAIFYL